MSITQQTPETWYRVGDWLPTEPQVLQDWLTELVKKVDREPRYFEVLLDEDPSSIQVHEVIRKFKKLIEEDPELKDDFPLMFSEVPKKPPYNSDPTRKPQIRDHIVMLKAFDVIIQSAPEYDDNALVGFPINAILDWPMGTETGLKLFHNAKLNKMFKEMFDVWAAYLESPASRTVLTTGVKGWFGAKASASMPGFDHVFECDSSKPHYGFKSWDDFFTRSFKEGVRPVVGPKNDSIVNSACESTVYRIATGVKLDDAFWLKGQPYSLKHMLNGNEYASQFVGGAVYQAFLSALNYHRWVSPVNGTILDIEEIPGTYYAESPVMGFGHPGGPDPAAPNNSQGYITSVAARMVIYIKADNPKIGLMAFVAVGMAEVSSCKNTVHKGDRVKKGTELGMFHFGGSTYCLLFRPETNITFTSESSPGSRVPLNYSIGFVGK